MDFYTSILPILVLYKQDLKSSSSLQTLNVNLMERGILMDLFVYDNSPIAQYESNFKYGIFNVYYQHDPLNSGVSLAYNTGASKARMLGKLWILLLDQDTIFPDHFLDVYASSALKHQDLKIFAPILKTQRGDYFSPCRYHHKRGYWLPIVKEGIMDVKRYSPVNSGMLIWLDAFFEVGGYNEAVKLDFADFQFIERFGMKYSKFYVLNLIGLQDFSGFDDSVSKLEHRFSFFCDGAKNCLRRHFFDGFWYLIVVLRRMSGLIWRYKKLSFLSIFVRNYLI